MSTLYTYNGKLLIVGGNLAASEDCCCKDDPCLGVCAIYPQTSEIRKWQMEEHEVDVCARVISLYHESGPLARPRNNPETSEPNTYEIFYGRVVDEDNNVLKPGTRIAYTQDSEGTFGWVGGSNYSDDPDYQPLVGGPEGVISGTKPKGPTKIQVVVGGNSPSFYTIACE